MKLKTVEVDGKVYAELSDGKPVYVEDDGRETAFDAPATRGTITRLNKEAQGHREGKENVEKLLKSFEGITDPAAAIKALNIVANLDAKKLVDAGEIDKVKAEISRAFQGQLEEANTKNKGLEEALYSEKIGGSFARSKFIAEKLAIPADMVQAAFGKNLKVEDGKIVAYDSNGNKIFSRARPGELAEFDEALELLVDAYPHKDHILKGSGGAGGGANPGGGSGGKEKPNLGGTEKERVTAIKERFPNLSSS